MSPSMLLRLALSLRFMLRRRKPQQWGKTSTNSRREAVSRAPSVTLSTSASADHYLLSARAMSAKNQNQAQIRLREQARSHRTMPNQRLRLSRKKILDQTRVENHHHRDLMLRIRRKSPAVPSQKRRNLARCNNLNPKPRKRTASLLKNKAPSRHLATEPSEELR